MHCDVVNVVVIFKTRRQISLFSILSSSTTERFRGVTLGAEEEISFFYLLYKDVHIVTLFSHFHHVSMVFYSVVFSYISL